MSALLPKVFRAYERLGFEKIARPGETTWHKKTHLSGVRFKWEKGNTSSKEAECE